MQSSEGFVGWFGFWLVGFFGCFVGLVVVWFGFCVVVLCFVLGNIKEIISSMCCQGAQK